jgi:hypothetical protein
LVDLSKIEPEVFGKNTILQSDVGTSETVQVMTMSESPGADSNTIPVSLPAPISQSTGIELNNYLKRPVLVQTYEWLENTPLVTSFNPWDLFLSHPSIKSRINNYAFLRCNLKMRVLISASPFYYGAAVCSWWPRWLDNVEPATLPGNSLMKYTQRPNIMIYPQTSTGGEMNIPFLSPKEYMDITTRADALDMGLMVVQSFGDLENANSVAGVSATVQFFVWAEDIELSGLTVNLAMQSGDEYSSGPISKPASAVAKMAGQLSSWPIIGSFATATSVAASAVANIASLFGYTNVPNISNQSAFRPTSTALLATTDIGMAVEKLTLDSKNELTIDNSSYSCGDSDPLSIASMVSRESYLTSFDWTAANSADDLIFNARVVPGLTDVVAGAASSSVVQGTPIWLVSQMFQYWRGDIKFRFVILCSQYHRGKLRISWDPVGANATTPNSFTELFSKVVDITEDTDITITVPYTQALAYLRTIRVPQTNATVYGTAALSHTVDDNGILCVRVLNKQTSPVASANIRVLVFVSGSTNMDFGSPVELNGDFSPYELQSGDLDLASTTNFNMDNVKNDPSHINLLYHGEKITSLRTLLRRANYVMSMSPTDFYTGYIYIRYVFARMPLFPGYDPNGIHVARKVIAPGTDAPYNYCSFSAINWIGQCFVGYRGSVIWHCNLGGNNASAQLSLKRNTSNTLATNFYVSAGTAVISSENEGAYTNLLFNGSSASGSTATNQRTQASLSLLAPFHSNFKWVPTQPANRTLGTSKYNTNTDAIGGYATYQASATDNGARAPLHMYCAIGTDFDPVFFLNVPTLFYRAGLPSPQP